MIHGFFRIFFNFHPLATAIIQKALEEHIESLPIKDFESHAGLGIEGMIQDKKYYIGNIL